MQMMALGSTDRMAEIFTPPWLDCYKDAWNRDADLVASLERIGFEATIGYGFPDSQQPVAVIRVRGGQIVATGPFQGEELDWDLRASPGDWKRWVSIPPGLLALSMAYTENRLRFRRGSYSEVVKNPRLAHPFVRSFVAMSAAERHASGTS